MPANTVRSRIEHIKQHGAEVRVIDGTYDDAVELLKSEAEKQGWQIISDTSYPGYYEIPFDIMTGYLTMFEEIRNQSDTYFDFIFLQGGVGAFPASAAAFFSKAFDNKITLVSVEPIAAACLFESIQSDHGQRVEAGGALDSIMAGLNCGLPSEIAWPIIRDRVHLFMAIEDDLARQAMKQFYVPAGNDPHIISGESGSAGLAALLALMTSKELLPVKKALGINTQSRILLVNTEGDTDPDNFQEIVTS